MKIILLAVTSLDGFITRGKDSDIYKWTSQEDQKVFFEKIKNASLIFMGSKTYESAKHLMKHTKGRTRVVFTRNPKKYKNELISGILEFTDKRPNEIVSKFENQGVKEAIIVGGSEINTLFLTLGLVSEIQLTIEPYIFGSGIKLFAKNVFTSLSLISKKTLNTKGTVFLKYKIL